VRVQTKDGWGLIRASNTGPQLILRFEGKTPEKLEEMKALFRGRSRNPSSGREDMIGAK